MMRYDAAPNFSGGTRTDGEVAQRIEKEGCHWLVARPADPRVWRWGRQPRQQCNSFCLVPRKIKKSFTICKRAVITHRTFAFADGAHCAQLMRRKLSFFVTPRGAS